MVRESCETCRDCVVDEYGNIVFRLCCNSNSSEWCSDYSRREGVIE